MEVHVKAAMDSRVEDRREKLTSYLLGTAKVLAANQRALRSSDYCEFTVDQDMTVVYAEGGWYGSNTIAPETVIGTDLKEYTGWKHHTQAVEFLKRTRSVSCFYTVTDPHTGPWFFEVVRLADGYRFGGTFLGRPTFLGDLSEELVSQVSK